MFIVAKVGHKSPPLIWSDTRTCGLKLRGPSKAQVRIASIHGISNNSNLPPKAASTSVQFEGLLLIHCSFPRSFLPLFSLQPCERLGFSWLFLPLRNPRTIMTTTRAIIERFWAERTAGEYLTPQETYGVLRRRTLVKALGVFWGSFWSGRRNTHQLLRWEVSLLLFIDPCLFFATLLSSHQCHQQHVPTRRGPFQKPFSAPKTAQLHNLFSFFALFYLSPALFLSKISSCTFVRKRKGTFVRKKEEPIQYTTF